MTLLSYNIRRGGTGRETVLAAVIASASPDIVVLQEATRPDTVERIAGLTGMTVWGARPGRSLAFLSRVPVGAVAWHRPRLSKHAFLELRTADPGPIVVGVHLSAVHSAWTEGRRVLELRALLAAIMPRRDAFHLIVGDFNTLAPGERLDVRRLPPRLRPFVWLSGGRIRWRTIQTMLDAGYVDGFRRLHPDLPGHTFPAWDPHIRLDYGFLPEGCAGRLRACEVLVGDDRLVQASDHLPVVIRLDATADGVEGPAGR